MVRNRSDHVRVRIPRARIRRRDGGRDGGGRRSRSRLGWRRRSLGSSSCGRTNSDRSWSYASLARTAARTSCRSSRWRMSSDLCSRIRRCRIYLHATHHARHTIKQAGWHYCTGAALDLISSQWGEIMMGRNIARHLHTTETTKAFGKQFPRTKDASLQMYRLWHHSVMRCSIRAINSLLLWRIGSRCDKCLMT